MTVAQHPLKPCSNYYGPYISWVLVFTVGYLLLPICKPCVGGVFGLSEKWAISPTPLNPTTMPTLNRFFSKCISLSPLIAVPKLYSNRRGYQSSKCEGPKA